MGATFLTSSQDQQDNLIFEQNEETTNYLSRYKKIENIYSVIEYNFLLLLSKEEKLKDDKESYQKQLKSDYYEIINTQNINKYSVNSIMQKLAFYRLTKVCKESFFSKKLKIEKNNKKSLETKADKLLNEYNAINTIFS